jgi:nitroreductase
MELLLMTKKRIAQYPIDEIFINRWSPRAMSGEPISDQELMKLFEAARWAPSSYNGQPWRFIYAKQATSHWERIFNLLVPFNQLWCKNAAVLVVIISHNTFPLHNKKARTHSFDTGAAWENLALQGSLMNLVVHGMEGFDYDRTRQELAIPQDYTVEAMCALGKPGNKENLPKELQEREEPSDRNPVSSFIFEGMFKNS